MNEFLDTNINYGRDCAVHVWILLYRPWKINHYMNYWIHYGTLKGYMPGASYMECFWSEKVSSTSSMASQVKLNSIWYYMHFSFETCYLCFTLQVPYVSVKVGLAPLRGEHRLWVSGNRVQRKVFGPKRSEVTDDWRKMHDEELHNLCSLPNTPPKFMSDMLLLRLPVETLWCKGNKCLKVYENITVWFIVKSFKQQ